jgi:hypothetical protein
MSAVKLGSERLQGTQQGAQDACPVFDGSGDIALVHIEQSCIYLEPASLRLTQG